MWIIQIEFKVSGTGDMSVSNSVQLVDLILFIKSIIIMVAIGHSS